MKKIILVCAGVCLISACSPGKKEPNKTSEVDSTKKDTTALTNTNNTGVKDYNYWAGKFKTPAVPGIELQTKQLTDHSEDKEIHISNYVTNAKEVGFDELTFSTVNPAMYAGEQQEKYKNFNKENFEYFQNLDDTQSKVTATEYKTGDLTFYYCIRKNNKGFMGKKDYHGLILEAKSGDLVLSMYITVFDLKSDMKQPEEWAKKIADWIAG